MARVTEYLLYNPANVDLNNDLFFIRQAFDDKTKKATLQQIKDLVGGGASGTAGGDLIGTYPNPTIASGAVTEAKIATNAVTSIKIANNAVTTNKIINNAVTNDKLAQMPANTVKANETNVSANPQDIPLLPFISGEATLVSGSRTIADSRVSASSVVLVTASSTGVLTSIPIRYTKNNGVSVVFSTGQATDTATFSYLIIF